MPREGKSCGRKKVKALLELGNFIEKEEGANNMQG